jgi:hypothetical protein
VKRDEPVGRAPIARRAELQAVVGAYLRSDGAIRAKLEHVVEFVLCLQERIGQVAGTLSFHVTPAVET